MGSEVEEAYESDNSNYQFCDSEIAVITGHRHRVPNAADERSLQNVNGQSVMGSIITDRTQRSIQQAKEVEKLHQEQKAVSYWKASGVLSRTDCLQVRS